MSLADLRSSLFAHDNRTPDEKAAVLAVIGSESPETLDLAEIRAICLYIREQLKDIAQDVEGKD